jgi:hypothetical protein
LNKGIPYLCLGFPLIEDFADQEYRFMVVSALSKIMKRNQSVFPGRFWKRKGRGAPHRIAPPRELRREE